MFLVNAVTSYFILSMKRVLEIKALSDIVFLVGAVNQRRLMLLTKVIILILCNKITR